VQIQFSQNHTIRVKERVVAWTSSQKSLSAVVEKQKENMKKQLSLVGLAAFALLAFSPSSVRAAIYDFSYTASGIQASGTFTTSDVLTPLLNNGNNSSSGQGSGYQIISLSGERNGDPISLLANPNFPHWTIDPFLQYQYDDALVTRAWGLSFDYYYGLILVDDTTGVQYNICGDSGIGNPHPPGTSTEYEATVALGYPPSVPIALTITPVPEPTTMIAGALLLLPFGASTVRILRRNRTA
jgi:hypothetical protein